MTPHSRKAVILLTLCFLVGVRQTFAVDSDDSDSNSSSGYATNDSWVMGFFANISPVEVAGAAGGGAASTAGGRAAGAARGEVAGAAGGGAASTAGGRAAGAARGEVAGAAGGAVGGAAGGAVGGAAGGGVASTAGGRAAGATVTGVVNDENNYPDGAGSGGVGRFDFRSSWNEQRIMCDPLALREHNQNRQPQVDDLAVITIPSWLCGEKDQNPNGTTHTAISNMTAGMLSRTLSRRWECWGTVLYVQAKIVELETVSDAMEQARRFPDIPKHYQQVRLEYPSANGSTYQTDWFDGGQILYLPREKEIAAFPGEVVNAFDGYERMPMYEAAGSAEGGSNNSDSYWSSYSNTSDSPQASDDYADQQHMQHLKQMLSENGETLDRRPSNESDPKPSIFNISAGSANSSQVNSSQVNVSQVNDSQVLQLYGSWNGWGMEDNGTGVVPASDLGNTPGDNGTSEGGKRETEGQNEDNATAAVPENDLRDTRSDNGTSDCRKRELEAQNATKEGGNKRHKHS